MGALLRLFLGVARQELDSCGIPDNCDMSEPMALGVDIGLDDTQNQYAMI